jgi:ribonuclease VapC
VSAANYVETAAVIDRSRDPVASRKVDELLAVSEVTIVAVTERQARIAREAYRDFGQGGGHPAQLNFGDCFAYALAKDTGEPLLFKGDGFQPHRCQARHQRRLIAISRSGCGAATRGGVPGGR